MSVQGALLETLIAKHPSVLVPKSYAQEQPEFDMSFQVLRILEALEKGKKANREHIDPLIFGPRILPYLVIIDVLDGGADFQWRLFGGAHEKEYGINLKGMILSELARANDGLEEVELIFRSCFHHAEPIFYNIRYLNQRDITRNCCGALYPLYDYATGEIAQLLGCTEWFNLERSQSNNPN